MCKFVTSDFVLQHREDDVRQLALQANKYPEVDMPYVLDQIAGWKKAKEKVPRWAACKDIIYPPHLNMEQCSSQTTAEYKQRLIAEILGEQRKTTTLVDLTGGWGVDFSFLAQIFGKAVYVERDEHLCRLARHNMPCLGLSDAAVVNDDSTKYLAGLQDDVQRLFFIDPARRDVQGRKVAGLEACTPDVLQLFDRMMSLSMGVMMKLSPMLDWHEAIRQLRKATSQAVFFDVHILSVHNECKELLVVATHHQHPLTVTCVNDGETFTYHAEEEKPSDVRYCNAEQLQDYRFLYAPNASLMKAGCFPELCARYDLDMADANSHLFLSHEMISAFPGRQFEILAISSLNKREVKQTLKDVGQANVAVRNFPMTAVELRKRLRLRDGGNSYIFATTIRRKHLLFLCQPVS